MKRAPIVTTAALAAFALGLAACQQTTPPPPAPSPPSGFDQGDTPSEPMPGATGESTSLGTIYFDLDRANIREDARSVLRSNAEQLRSSNSSVTIEGHCDERGDEEYNLALGERRANAVRKYLVNLGVGSGQLRTLSYGETKPSATGHSEAAWQWNRRAEFKTR